MDVCISMKALTVMFLILESWHGCMSYVCHITNVKTMTLDYDILLLSVHVDIHAYSIPGYYQIKNMQKDPSTAIFLLSLALVLVTFLAFITTP